MENFVEQLVAEYYKTKGYFVMTNYWLPFKLTIKSQHKGKNHEYESQSWTDIDIVARNNEELLLIQVKTIVNTKYVAERIITYFQRIKDFLDAKVSLDGTSDISWWNQGVTTRFQMVYDYYSAPSYLKLLYDESIEVIKFSDLFKEILSYVEQKAGVKEQNASMRFLHFLLKEDLLKRSGQGD